MIWVGVEQAALRCRDLSLKDDALSGANQDGPCAGFIAQQLVPAHALNEVASPAGQTAHLLCVSVEVQTLTGAQADQQMGACRGKIWRRIQLLLLKSQTQIFSAKYTMQLSCPIMTYGQCFRRGFFFLTSWIQEQPVHFTFIFPP